MSLTVEVSRYKSVTERESCSDVSNSGSVGLSSSVPRLVEEKVTEPSGAVLMSSSVMGSTSYFTKPLAVSDSVPDGRSVSWSRS